MKAYVIGTGAIFVIVTLAHIWRAILEGPRLATDFWFVFSTIIAASFCVWSWRVFRSLPRA